MLFIMIRCTIVSVCRLKYPVLFLYQNWYNLSKTEAESEAWEYAKRSGLDVVAICPSLILGPILQSTVNASTMVLIKILKGS
jgi:nucleoside-diphosphate-sugar epimerase